MARLRRIRGRTLAVLIAAVAILAIGASMVIAATPFTDVPASAYYADDVDAIYNAGITGGCTPTKYCPNDYVTRGQMAVFLNKLGALGPGTTPVATAAKLGFKATSHTVGSQDLTNDDAYHILTSASISPARACTLLMSGSLSAFTYNFTDYRRLEADFFVDGVAVGMRAFDDNDTITSTFASLSVTGFKAVAGGAHTITLRGRISTGTNILRIYEPTFYAICV